MIETNAGRVVAVMTDEIVRPDLSVRLLEDETVDKGAATLTRDRNSRVSTSRSSDPHVARSVHVRHGGPVSFDELLGAFERWNNS